MTAAPSNARADAHPAHSEALLRHFDAPEPHRTRRRRRNDAPRERFSRFA